MTVLPITTEYIKLQDLMKLADLVSTGGEAKLRILNEEVTVNSEVCTMRGKKLRPGDVVSFAGRELTVEYAILLRQNSCKNVIYRN